MKRFFKVENGRVEKITAKKALDINLSEFDTNLKLIVNASHPSVALKLAQDYDNNILGIDNIYVPGLGSIACLQE